MYRIVLTTGQQICFEGEYLKERETENWHYYETPYGIIHIRKEHIAMVIEGESPMFYYISGPNT